MYGKRKVNNSKRLITYRGIIALNKELNGNPFYTCQSETKDYILVSMIIYYNGTFDGAALIDECTVELRNATSKLVIAYGQKTGKYRHIRVFCFKL